MASPKVIAKRYSKALFEMAQEASKSPSELFKNLENLSGTIAEHASLGALLRSPIFSFEEKWTVLSSIMKTEKFDEKVQNFVRVLVETDRILVLNEIVSDFKERVMALENSVEALIETAHQLGAEELVDLQKTLEKLFKRKILPRVTLNPALIAGLKVNVLGKTLDASLASSLNAIQKKLTTAQA